MEKAQRANDEVEIARLVALVDQAFAYAVALDKAEAIAYERARAEAERNH